MCGRYAVFTLSPELIEEVLGFLPIDEHGLLVPRWNVAPTQRAPVFRAPGGRRELAALRWGLVPSWAEDLKIGARMINARAETVASKPSFRAAFESRRCLVPASQFYEWTKTTTPKQPFLIRCKDAPAFLMAGLWESWTDEATGEVVDTFTIVTTDANETVRPVHDRMPVILPRADWSAWLDPANRDAASLAKLLRPYEGPMEARAITTSINDARRNEPPVPL